MEYAERTERSETHAQAALRLLEQHKIAPNPINFTVAYVHDSGRDPELSRMLNAVLAEGGSLNADMVREAFERHFGLAREAQVVREGGARLAAEAERALGAAESAQSALGIAADEAARLAERLDRGEGTDPRRLADAARALAMLARKTAQRTDAAARSLDAATDQIGGVRRDLDRVRRELATDGLTGLANRRHFERRLAEEAALARDTGDPLTVMLVDVEGFDVIAASHGIGIGDQVLRLVGKTLADGVRGRDVAARFGPERFAVALPHTTEAEAAAIADQIRSIVAGRRIVRRDNREPIGRIALNVGRATLQPGEEIGHLIGRVEAMLDSTARRARPGR
ncbi:GGDEF domain-containing protein [Tistrella bauzanensis]|uniref:diguanylate cyclase n=1 Tax=Tistrella arctica TaxID=3133430 RepID=A0ABU9YFV5_9PROT